MPSPAANRRGILAMLVAMTLFIGNDAVVKLVASTYPPGEIMAIRGVFASLLSLGLVAAMAELPRLETLRSRLVLGRALLEGVITFLYILCLAHLPLANVTAILQTSPMLITLILAVSGVERVGWRRWAAVMAGFVGVVLIVKPDPDGFNVFASITLGAAVLVAVRDLSTRFIGHHVPSVVVTFATTTAVTLCGLVLALRETWEPPAMRETLLLIVAATLVTFGNFAAIIALRGTDISVVSPFRYSIVVFAIILGLAVFGEVPDLLTCAGIALIALSGVYTIHREHVRLREASRPLAATGAAGRSR